MEAMSLNEWIASTGDKREDCFDPGYRDLYLDIGFFAVQFAGVDLALTSLLMIATQSGDPKAFDILVSGMDARVKVSRFRQAVKLHGKIGPNLDVRLRVFEDQSIKLRNKLAHGTILPCHDDPNFYRIISMLKQPEEAKGRHARAESPEKLRSDQIWKHGIWLSQLVGDLSTVPMKWLFNSEFEISSPKTPVLLAGRQ